MSGGSNKWEVMASTAEPTALGSRKHRKTCTGCWTCRARKIKCDEGRPECRMCQAKAVACEGYGVRLRWLPPEGALPSSDSFKTLGSKSQRTQVAPAPDRPLPEHDEIDQILHSIDAFRPDSSSDHVEKSLYLHDFGVFDSGVDSSPYRLSPLTNSIPTTHLPSTDYDIGLVVSHHQVASNQSFTDEDLYCSFAFLDSALPYLDVDDDQSAEHFGNLNAISGTSSTTWCQSPGAPPLDNRPEDIPGHDVTLTVLERHCQWQESDGAIIRKPPTSPLPELEHFLIYHYAHRVVNLFTVIDNRKSPWRTIHLPRALQSVGQLSVEGSTLMIRDALRNALLSISAFCLSNDLKSRFCVDEAARWAYQATSFRGRAIKLLKDAAKNDLNAGSVPKYKEFLATMLSMITINVMSGDTNTCAVHLDGASRFIHQARSWKSKYSRKAQSLHRVYFYLRTIYESTAPADRTSTESGPTLSQPDMSGARIPGLTDFAEAPNEVCPSPTPSRTLESTAQMSTYACIYGVPQNLLVLLQKSTRLINEVTAARERRQTTEIPINLAVQCDELEKTILDWPIESELGKCNIDGMEASSSIIRKATQAYHNALIIYFAQHIRLMGYRYLQPYVEVVLQRVEAIEQIKAQTHVLASRLAYCDITR